MKTIAETLDHLQAFADKFPGATVEYHKMVLRDPNGGAGYVTSEWFVGHSDAEIRQAQYDVQKAATEAMNKPIEMTEAAKPKAARGKKAAPATTGQLNTTAAASPPAPTPDTFAAGNQQVDLFGDPAPSPAPHLPSVPVPNELTIMDVRNALTSVQTHFGHKDFAITVLKKFTRDGNATTSSLSKEAYAPLIAATKHIVTLKPEAHEEYLRNLSRPQ